MDINPDAGGFAAAYEAGRGQVVWTRLVADLETPVSAMMKLARGRPMSFLLESVEGGAIRGRYSFIGFAPDLVWRCFGERAEINRDVESGPDRFQPCPAPSLDALRALVAESKIDLPEGVPPMAAGLVGYLGYDMVRQVERLPDANPDVLGLPDGLFMRPTVIAVFDNVDDSLSVITPVRPKPGLDAAAAYARARARLQRVMDDFAAAVPPQDAAPGAAAPAEPLSNVAHADYLAMVERAKEYIRAGDVFQVVPSQRFRTPFHLPPLALYRSLRRLNPSPFLFFLDFGGFSVVGSSPEILVRVRDGRVTIRPIAGTRRRGATRAEDEALAADLLADPKELAEHLMLLDLGRNDVGRVAKIATVEVTDQFLVERYSHVMHIVSNVEGELDDDRYDAIGALMAGFPAGTVSGAPKVRAMEIIDELEPERRGIYGGCIGYFDAGGDMDSCIALRTGIIKDGMLYVQAGGGVVADSDAEAEYSETVNKARALFRAAEEALRFASGNG